MQTREPSAKAASCEPLSVLLRRVLMGKNMEGRGGGSGRSHLSRALEEKFQVREQVRCGDEVCEGSDVIVDPQLRGAGWSPAPSPPSLMRRRPTMPRLTLPQPGGLQSPPDPCVPPEERIALSMHSSSHVATNARARARVTFRPHEVRTCERCSVETLSPDPKQVETHLPIHLSRENGLKQVTPTGMRLMVTFSSSIPDRSAGRSVRCQRKNKQQRKSLTSICIYRILCKIQDIQCKS